MTFNDEPLNCTRRIGVGSFGTVYTLDEKTKCVKLIPGLKVFTSESDLKEAYHIMQDAKLLMNKSTESDYCPNVIKYFGLFENDLKEKLGIITEYFEVNIFLN